MIGDRDEIDQVKASGMNPINVISSRSFGRGEEGGRKKEVHGYLGRRTILFRQSNDVFWAKKKNGMNVWIARKSRSPLIILMMFR